MSWPYLVPAGLTAALEAYFGYTEVVNPPKALGIAFGNAYKPPSDGTWGQLEVVTQNMGLYNLFLALGLALSVTGIIGAKAATMFFSACVAFAGLFALCIVGWSVAFAAQLAFGLVAVIAIFLQPQAAGG